MQNLRKYTTEASHNPSYFRWEYEEKIINIQETSMGPPQKEMNTPENEATQSSPMKRTECSTEWGYFVEINSPIQCKSQQAAI